MAKRVVDFFPQFGEYIEGDVGIELEVESRAPIPAMNRGHWVQKAEGSLRNFGTEFISRKPFKVDDTLKRKITQLTEHIEAYGPVKDCPRTSLHVHLNALRSTPAQVWARAAAYWLVENVLTKHCGEELREGNLFCLRMKDAEGVLYTSGIDVDKPSKMGPFYSFSEDFRYCGQNLASLVKFGSIEIRTMKGLVDAQEIYEWTVNLWHLSEKASELGTSANLMDTYYRVGDEGILDYLLLPNFATKMKKIKGYKDLIRENVWPLTQFAYGRDWGDYTRKLEGRKAKKEEINPIPDNAFIVAGAGIQPGAINWVDDMPVAPRRRAGIFNR